jgi:CxxC-x17-CxxC domain-containing protein
MSAATNTRTNTAAAPVFNDQCLTCVECKQEFVWTAGEQRFFFDKGLKNEPRRCKPCKSAQKERIAARAAAVETTVAGGTRQRIECEVNCARCGQRTTVPFYPKGHTPVYCRPCYRVANG